MSVQLSRSTEGGREQYRLAPRTLKDYQRQILTPRYIYYEKGINRLRFLETVRYCIPLRTFLEPHVDEAQDPTTEKLILFQEAFKACNANRAASSFAEACVVPMPTPTLTPSTTLKNE